MTIILLLVAALPISQLAGQPYETKRRKRRRRSPCQSSFWPSSKTAVGAKLPVTILKVFFFYFYLGEHSARSQNWVEALRMRRDKVK